MTNLKIPQCLRQGQLKGPNSSEKGKCLQIAKIKKSLQEPNALETGIKRFKRWSLDKIKGRINKWTEKVMSRPCLENRKKTQFIGYLQYVSGREDKANQWIGITTEAEKFMRRNKTWQDLIFKKCNQIMLLCQGIERALAVRYDGPVRSKGEKEKKVYMNKEILYFN